MSESPNVLVFGGLEHVTPNLIQYLLSNEANQARVGFIRVADKFSVNPPTTFVPKGFRTQLKEQPASLEYRQADLHSADAIAKAFDDPTPNGRGFTHIFDFTGNWRPTTVSAEQVSDTFAIALALARAASQRNVKAYIRTIGPFFDHADPTKKFKEEDEKGWAPDGLRGVWWTEMLRAVGSIPGLPLVVLRSGAVYGQGIVAIEISKAILLGLVYKRLNQEMKLPWSPKVRKNTCHIVDFCAAMWTAAEWISSIDRSKADTIAGVALQPTGNESVDTVPDAIPKSAGAVTIPIFNVVDDSDTTQESLGIVIGSVFGIKTGSYGNTRSVPEDLNALHMEQWGQIIQQSTPPVVDTPLNPYMHSHILEEHGYAMDGEKLKRVLNFRHSYPQLNEEAVREFISWCRQEGIWPESDLYVDSNKPK